MYKRLLSGLIAAIMLTLSCACGANKTEEEELPAAEQTSAAALQGYRETVLYYATDDAHMVPVMKMIPWEEGIGKAALRCLENTVENRSQAAKQGLVLPIPEGTVYSLRINGEKTATVDLAHLKQGMSEAQERAMVVSIVNTLAEFPTVEKVRFTLDGNAAETLPCGTPINEAYFPFPLNAEGAAESSALEGRNASTLFFPNRSATLNIPVTRYGDGERNFETAIASLIEGPRDSDLICCFPEGTTLLYADLFDGSATVNLSGEFLSAQYTEGLAEAAFKTMFLTANAIEPIYELTVLVEGIPYSFEEMTEVPVYPNEIRFGS